MSSSSSASNGGGILKTATKTLAPVDEAEVELMKNFGEHQLMNRVQNVLKQQLTTNLLRIEAELRAQEEAREAAKKSREDVGVELYGIQQQFARVQTDLQNKSSTVSNLQEQRAQKEEDLRNATNSYAVRRATLEDQRTKLEKFRGELDGLLDTVRQVEKYNNEIQAELALTRRATLKAEEDTQDKEKAKTAQDLYVDHLQTQVTRMADQLALYQSQIDAQKQEASTATTTINDAMTEMETIWFEKQQLMLQWQSSLVQMRRRDEVLVATRKAINEIQAAISSMDAEDGNLRKVLVTAQAAHARLQDQFDREQGDLKYLEGQVDLLRRQFTALEEKQEELVGTLDATDAEVKHTMVEQTRLIRNVREFENQREFIDRKRFSLEDEINEVLNGKITNEKAAKSLIKDANKLIEKIRSIEITKAEAENVIAENKVAALNLSSHIAGLREILAQREGDVKEKESLIEQYSIEIRQRTDAIDKKMAIVDRLNRKWEKMINASPENENMGPLHAEVHNMIKTIATVRENSEALQRRWLADQTVLVSTTNDSEIKKTQLREASSQAVLLNQKRIRLDAAIAAHRNELRRLEAGVKTMHDDMSRISGLISKNNQLGQRLMTVTDTNERAFSEELKDMETEAATADARIASLHEERNRLLEELVECERQVILWEKKITLEKATQEALDPSVGESELASMEKEVNRMRSRYESMKRDQEKLIAEMERAIEKRDVIAMKNRSTRQLTLEAAATIGRGTAAGAAGGLGNLGGNINISTLKTTTGGGKASEGATLTKIGLQQRAAALRKDITTKLAQGEELDRQIQQRQEDSQTILVTVQTRTNEMDRLEARATQLQRAISDSQYEKQKAIERLQGLMRMIQRFDALENGRLPGLTSDEIVHVRERLQEAEGARDAVKIIIDQISQQHIELAEILDRVKQLTETAPL